MKYITILALLLPIIACSQAESRVTKRQVIHRLRKLSTKTPSSSSKAPASSSKGPSKSSTTNLKRAIKSMCLLVKHGANVDEINPHWNMTHVFWAVMNQCYKTTKCLLELGADANIPAGANKHPSLSKLHGKRISQSSFRTDEDQGIHATVFFWRSC